MNNMVAASGRVCIILFAVLTFTLFMRPTTAFAQTLHATLLYSNPTEGSVLKVAPSSVQLRFSEQVQIIGQAITVLSPTGISATQGTVHVQGATIWVALDARKEGTYLVTWQVISQDTDPASGSFVFSVERVAGRWSDVTGQEGVTPAGLWLQVLARWLHFLGYALSFGVLAFRYVVLRPLKLERKSVLEQRIDWLVSLGIIILLLAEPCALLAQTVSLGTGQFVDPNVANELLISSFGRVVALRLGAALLLWVLIGAAKEGAKRATVLALVLGGALALVDSEASHAVLSSPLWLALIATASHIIAMGVWLGGLLALLAIWRLQQSNALHSTLLASFGGLALIMVIELAMSGVVLALLRLPRPSLLLTDTYGLLIVIKTVLLLAVLLLVYLTGKAYQKYRQVSVRTEILILLLVLVCAGLLVSLPPPR